MRRLFDYFGDMRSSRKLGREIDDLLDGGLPSEELSDVAILLAEWSSDARGFRIDGEQLATRAARIASRPTATGGARLPATLGRRTTFSLAAGALVIGLAGTAFAANGAGPGDGLYPLDRTLESFGIGDGGVSERIEEADRLLVRGETDDAIAHLVTTIDEAVDSGDFEAASNVQRHLDLALTKANPQAEESQLKVAALEEFIEENRGSGVGVDGSEYGHTVSRIARGLEVPTSPSSPESAVLEGPSSGGSDPTTAGPPENAGPKPDHGNAPDHAGPKDTTGEPGGNGQGSGQGQGHHPGD